MNADGLFDGVTKPITNFQIFRCIPATHSPVLQISVYAFCKLFVLMVVTDEAGIEFNCVSDGTDVVNHVIGDATATEEVFRNLTI